MLQFTSLIVNPRGFRSGVSARAKRGRRHADADSSIGRDLRDPHPRGDDEFEKVRVAAGKDNLAGEGVVSQIQRVSEGGSGGIREIGGSETLMAAARGSVQPSSPSARRTRPRFVVFIRSGRNWSRKDRPWGIQIIIESRPLPRQAGNTTEGNCARNLLRQG